MMVAPRSLFFSILSLACVGVFLYYIFLSQGPQILRWSQFSENKSEAASPHEILQDSKASDSSETNLTQVEKFDPEVLLSAPRRGSAIPNPQGDLAVYTVSTYSFKSHIQTKEIRVLDVASGHSRLISNDKNAGSPNWLNNKNLIWLDVGQNQTKLTVGNADEAGKTYIAATVPAPISDIKVKILEDGKVALALVAQARPDGSLFEPEKQLRPKSSAKLYDGVFVRHWDEYVTPNKNAIWHGIMEERNKKYTLGPLTNILKGTRLESPIPTFGSTDNFDVGSKGVCFVAKDPDLKAAFHTKSNFYFVSVEGGSEGGLKYSEPVKFVADKYEGASTSPSFSPDGESAVYLQMRIDGYESDKNHVFILDIAKPDDIQEPFATYDGKGLWDKSPSSVSWSGDAQAILMTAEDNGRTKLFKLILPENVRNMVETPEGVTDQGHVSEFLSLGSKSSRLLLSSSSFVDNSYYSTLDLKDENSEPKVVSSSSRNGSFFHLSDDQITEFWFKGAEEYQVHAWVIKPSDFDAEKQYPLAYLIHGGPQGSWQESWSTRWNPLVFAEQGYVVVLPDPTGSTGYGQEFTDAIKEQWGGRPYQDLVKGFEYIKENLTFVDTTNAVALGASYGGYMMAWIQGHPLAKEFKALVCHDGSFNVPAQLSSDEIYFPNREFGTPITDDPHAWDKWSPHSHVSNWSTPMLVIHNELDYRLPISEGLAMFNALQERNIKSRFLTFPDENHWVLNEENSLVWHTVVINWINSFVGLPPYRNETDLGIEVQN